MVIKMINFEMILEGQKIQFKIYPEGYQIFKKTESDNDFHGINIQYEAVIIYLLCANKLFPDFKLEYDHDKLKESIINRKEFFDYFKEKEYES